MAPADNTRGKPMVSTSFFFPFSAFCILSVLGAGGGEKALKYIQEKIQLEPKIKAPFQNQNYKKKEEKKSTRQ